MVIANTKRLLFLTVLAIAISFFVLVNDVESVRAGWIYAGLGGFIILAYSREKWLT